LGSVNEYQLRLGRQRQVWYGILGFNVPLDTILVISKTAKAGMAHSDCGRTCGCAGKTVKSLENTCHT